MRAHAWYSMSLLLVGSASTAVQAQIFRSGSGDHGTREFLGFPVVLASPSIGFGLGGVAAWLFTPDSLTPASAVGVGGGFASSRSWGLGAAGHMHLAEDAWRGDAQALFSRQRYNFFGAGNAAGNAGQWIPIDQDDDGGQLELARRVLPHFYVGLRGTYTRLITSPDHSDEIGELADTVREQHHDVSAFVGPTLNYDTRDNEFDAQHGTYGHFVAQFANSSIGSTETFQSYHGSANQYIPVHHDQVVALRLFGCGVSGDVPVWQLCQFGDGADLRGYEAGRYRDRALVAGQGEWRTHVWRRFGAVAFAGVGEVAPAMSALNSSNLLASVGVGARYLAAHNPRINIGADYAWGKNGGAFYLRLGEAY